ncbi:HAMP domain-containing histidine kinase [Pseudoalteromonas sp. SMS1]|uniref:sensor histidine kinase n=1 Tax=Pseudoalteromonas sp. SMS1 TaxID=2908894 RepID=UPI001F38D594|nr:HAMP domain-containing sensor histidine kinase [Pseudoalteromonas sp. SMS1]MCF2857108.1 HAMP domain-containing histidine kinase [Pseudoalteromonas sp. SMS1]
MKLRDLLFITSFPLVVIGPILVGVISYQFLKESTFDKLQVVNAIHTEDFVELHITARHDILVKNKMDGLKNYVKAYKDEVVVEIQSEDESYEGSFVVVDNQGDHFFYNREYFVGVTDSELGMSLAGLKQGTRIIELKGKKYVFSKLQFLPWKWDIYGLYPIEETSELLKEVAFAVFLVCGLILVALFTVTSLMYRYFVIKPLSEINSFSERLSNLALDGRLRIKSPEEFRALSKHLDRMRVSLTENIGKIEKANEELSQFSYRTSHDLKSPLTASKKLTEYILQDIDSGDIEEAKSSVKRVQSQVTKLESLVDDVLSLTKIDLITENEIEFDLNALIDDIVDKRKTFFEDDCCVFSASVELADPIISGHKIRYQQIIENLVSNGFKYQDEQKENPYVKLHVACVGDLLSIIVEDNGVGIPDKYHNEIYQMFKRFHPSLASGSGLGLAIVKKHVEKMQGSIHFSSSPQGTIFQVDIKRN